MDSLSGLFENGTGHTVVVVHSPRARTATDAKKPRVLPKTRDVHDVRNYLPGGSRQQADLVRAQARDLRTANSALAGELLRTRQESEREICSLRNEVAELGAKCKAEHERLALLKERLACEARTQGQLEDVHQERVRDLQKRIQAEHLLRTAAEQELGRSQDKSGCVAVQLRGVEQELEGAMKDAGQLRDQRLELEMALNRERRERAEVQAELEATRSQLARERQAREQQARQVAEQEATIRGMTERNSQLFEESRAGEEALAIAKESRGTLEATLAKQRQELRVLEQQLEGAKRARAAAQEEQRQLAERVADMEAATALSIAKDAHYDDLKAEFDAAGAQLKQMQGKLDSARAEAKNLTARLEEASSQATLVPGLQENLSKTEAARKALEEQLGMAQSAVKALMAAVQEKEGSIEKFEEQLTELQRATETLRRSKEELGKEAAEHGACIEALRQELRGLHEEQSTWQRRHKQLAVEADSRDLELARRDLKIKELTDALHLLTSKVGDEQVAAANERRRLEGLIKSMEARTSQTQMELARCKDELRTTEQGQHTARAELAAAQEECSHLRGQLAEEQLRASKLRGDLMALTTSHSREVESKGQAAAELLVRLQAEEAAKQQAVQEGKVLRRRVEELEGTLAEVGEGRARTAEAYETSQAALESMKRKLDIYKKENKNLLSSYDDWLKTLTKR